MTASEILKLIENVQPDDVAGLDEIDKLIWVTYRPKQIRKPAGSYPKYTRSRDILSAIRPEGYSYFRIVNDGSGLITCTLGKSGWELPLCARADGNEKLIELEAIIKALDYERSKK